MHIYNRGSRFEVVGGLVVDVIIRSLYLDPELSLAIKQLNELNKKYSKTHTDLKIELVPEDYDEGNKLIITGLRPPTVEEMAAILAQQEADRIGTEARERDELKRLEHLQAKYKDKTIN